MFHDDVISDLFFCVNVFAAYLASDTRKIHVSVKMFLNMKNVLVEHPLTQITLILSLATTCDRMPFYSTFSHECCVAFITRESFPVVPKVKIILSQRAETRIANRAVTKLLVDFNQVISEAVGKIELLTAHMAGTQLS